jgi:hypothetical protein
MRSNRPIAHCSLGAVAALVVGITACGSNSSGPARRFDATADMVADTVADISVTTNNDLGPEVGPDLNRAAGDVAPASDLLPSSSLDAGSDAQLADARDGSDGRSPDLASQVVVEVGTEVGDTSLSVCGSVLSGTSPFGSALIGTASFASMFSGTKPTIEGTVIAHIYFPSGRVAGAPVQLSMQSPATTEQYFFGSAVILADDLSATGLTVSGHNMTITANLLSGTGGLQATVTKNFANPGGDVADTRTGSMLMCPGGDVPAPSMQISATVASPLSAFSVNATTPITASALEALRVSSPLGAVATNVASNSSSMFATGPNATIASTSAFPPGQPLFFDASQVRDVLGRAVPLTLAGTAVLATTAALSDLTFATTPPTGALACSAAPVCTKASFPTLDASPPSGMSRCIGGGSIANGVLTVGWGMASGPNVDALLALPGTSATKLRVRVSVGDKSTAGSCLNGNATASMLWAAMAVVGPNGEASPRVTLTCDGAMVDHVIDLPGVAPLWLAVHVEGVTRVPYMSPVPGPPNVLIDELELL